MTRQAKREKWDGIIRDFESSGLSAYRYAKEHQISKSSLYIELRKRRTRSKTSPQQPAVHEFKLSELQPYKPPQALKVNIGEADLIFGELPDPQWLAALIKEVER
jgi:hypothetical protein